jgi:hypothetical protein
MLIGATEYAEARAEVLAGLRRERRVCDWVGRVPSEARCCAVNSNCQE